MTTTPATPAAWVDGDPLMEAIAAAVWEQCSTEGTSLVVDDPRNIAAVAAHALDSYSATEFRLMPAPPAYTPLIVRRDAAYDGTRWAVLHDPGDLAVRRIWTPEGWEMAWASTDDEIYCWPDAASALAAARQAQAEDDREPDVDGAGRTPESYRDGGCSAAATADTNGWPGDEHAEPGTRGWTA